MEMEPDADGNICQSPDLVICGEGSDSPEISGNMKCYSVEISLENLKNTSTVKFSSFNQQISPESSLELLPAGDNAPLVPELDGEWTYDRLNTEFESQREELAETRKALNQLKIENQIKTKECEEASGSLQQLQNELMRKSMHVGSLAFAIEGQVKEKTRWFSSLRDITRKLKIMKMEQIKLAEEASQYKKYVEDMNEMNSTIQSTIADQVNSHEQLKEKYINGTKERKELYNKVLELKGNIRVFCRCRPLNRDEIAAGASMAIDFDSAKDGELTVISNGTPRKTFKFDAFFGPQATQGDVFEDTAPFATSVLDGYNVCIFAYGQTGSGKTFTMEGTEEARGVNFKTLEELFRIIKEREKLCRYDISVSVLEVYNEQIRDLLVLDSQKGTTSKRLEVRQAAEGMHHIPGLVEAPVSNMTEVWEVLQTGSSARAVGSTNANEYSSRSHCIHCVMVRGENLLNGERTKSKLWLVDLAGSERVAKTEVQGERLKETQNINRSLSALGDVISALATKSPHIPFRNSKLTHLLQDSLGGDSKTLMFVQISPNENDLSETLCSLNFASRVRGIELGLAKKHFDSSELIRYKQMVEKLKQDIQSKDVQSKKMEETIYRLDTKIRERDLKVKLLQDKMKELESQLLIERKLARQHVDTKLAEQQIKQEEQQSNAPVPRPPLANRILTSTVTKEQENSTVQLNNLNLIENSSYCYRQPPVTDNYAKTTIINTEKENNPLVPIVLQPKRTGRASICTAARRNIPIGPPAPRRNSLMMPLPTSGPAPLSQLPPPPQPLIEDDERECLGECLPEQVICASPKDIRTGGGKKLMNSILRRSIQKRMQMKTPMQQHISRRVGVNVGLERVRVSIGSRGRMAHRVLLGSGRRVVNKDTQQKKEKERGWNISGTVGR